MIKSLDFFLIQQVLYKWNFFRFGQILFNLAGTFAAHHEKEALFLRFFKGLY